MDNSPAATVTSMQARLREILRDLHHPPLAAGVALAEEAGEAARILLDHHCYGKPLEARDLGGELADIFVCLCEIATLHRIDLAANLTAKIADLEKRAPKWRADLGAAVRRSWRDVHGPGAVDPDA